MDIVSGTRTLFHEQQFLNVSFRGAHVLPVQDTSVASVISYAVKNKGASSLSAALEISPNGIDFTEDAVATIDAGALKVIVPNRFLRWTRVRLTSAHREKAAADVYYQDQTLGISREGH
ncbi:DUF6385 domain-containing protein [Paenibacillus taiwanensis]|uniref:DUF6385 domain-containing protein n=1 Tax=Paenibacillus taiwanensis TaxID=401638 RepID=UPI0003FB2233|nr:DUF6385 domain-containing protein [Paenibacillus taiwanensis]